MRAVAGGVFGWLRSVLGAVGRDWQLWRAEERQPRYSLAPAGDAGPLTPYPIDMAPLLALPFGSLDDEGVLRNAATIMGPETYQPTSIAQYALAHWNAYLATGDSGHRDGFLAQTRWLARHAVPVSADLCVWPLTQDAPAFYATSPWLSALTQGNIASVFVRAYQLTGDAGYLGLARRALRAFELDALDGGVACPLGESGSYFEEVAVYPAAHILNGYVLALFGLYDYVALTGDAALGTLMERSLAVHHTLLDAFDTGYWTRYDLLRGFLASPFYHALHVTLLEALARISGCAHCQATAARWRAYQRRRGCRLRYLIASRAARARRGMMRALRRRWLPDHGARLADAPEPVCVAITGFPVAGGMRGVLDGVASAMAADWRLDYLTRRVGREASRYRVHAFGGRHATPWQFPGVWLYVLSGARALVRLVRGGQPYRLVLPQDGVFTGVCAALAGRLLGVRVVTMDHGTVTLPYSQSYRAERLGALRTLAPARRLLWRLGYFLYWPSLRVLVRVATRLTDHFLVAGDEVQEIYQRRLGVPAYRISRYPYVVPVERFAPASAGTRAALRRQLGVPEDALLVTMINRLEPNKGLEVALAGLRRSLDALPAGTRGRVRMLIAGAGWLRPRLEQEIKHLGLSDVCTLWGEATPDDVARLLAAAEIFVYAGTRGTNYSMAVLEAMAAGCAVIATDQPRSNVRLLAEGRGIAIPAGDVEALAAAVTHLLRDPGAAWQMGQRARAYIATRYTPDALRRALLRATVWSAYPVGLAAGRAEGVEPPPVVAVDAVDAGSGEKPTAAPTATPVTATASDATTRDLVVGDHATDDTPRHPATEQPPASRQRRGPGTWKRGHMRTGDAEVLGPLATLLRTSGIYALAAAGGPLLTLVLAPFLTRYLSAAAYGILTILTVVISLGAGISQLGLGSAFFRAYNYDYANQRDQQAVLATTATLLLIASLACAVAMTLAGGPLADVLVGQPALGSLVALAGGVILAQNLTVPGFAALRAENRALPYAMLSLGSVVVNVVTTVAFVAWLRLGIAGALLGLGCGYLCVALCSLPAIIIRAGLRLRGDVARNLLSFGLPLVLNFVSYWVLSLSDRYLLGRLGSLTETAVYGVAYTLGSALSIVVIGPFTLAWPTAMYTIARRANAAATFRLVFRWLSVVLLLAAYALSLAGSACLQWLFPPRYGTAALVIPIVAESLVFYGVYFVFMIGANVRRMTWLAAVFTTSAALANVALNLVLIPRYGALGAALATLLAYALLAALAYAVNQRVYPLPFEVAGFGAAVLLGMGLYALSMAAPRWWGAQWSGLCAFAGLALYGACLTVSAIGASRPRVRSAVAEWHVDVERRPG
jgi:O-antigen/teichoic acid export membrane protein/glycosyltransferase involved in cell wall biosynthesis